MQKNFNLFVIISFLSVQMLSFVHAAEHVFDAHEHNGEVCTIHAYCEQTTYYLAESPITTQRVHHPGFTLSSTALTIILSTNYHAALSRAPPPSS